MKVSGSSTLSTGKVDEKVITTGSTKINGDFECEGFRSSGSLKGSGNLTVNGDFRCAGTFRLNGSVNIKGDARSSGTTIIDGELQINGYYSKSGSLKIGKQVKATKGVKISGSTSIKGNLISEKNVEIYGSTTIDGNIKADNVYIGNPIDNLRPWQPYKIYGNIIADNAVIIKKTFVGGDIEGWSVKIENGCHVEGTVYYVNSIEVNPRVKLANKPVQIKDK
ncbi:MAG: polymer-forming cytoskeletal protein [Candidatus Heimdallarchaeota archaeon]